MNPSSVFRLYLFAASQLALGLAMLPAQENPPPDNADKYDAVSLPKFTVREERDRGYMATNTYSGTRIATSAMDIPQSIGIVNRELINDTGAQSITEATRYISGVAMGANNAADFNLIRGISGRGTNVDGFGETGEINTDLANVERIEIIKGPIGLLISGSNGGSINQITKSPLPVSHQSVKAQVGMYDANRVEMDSTGPILQDGSLLYRAVAAYQNSEGYRNFSELQRFVVAPSLAYRFTPQAELLVKFEGISEEKGDNPGFFIDPRTNKVVDIPRDRALSENTDLNYRNEDKYRLLSQLSVRLNRSWSMLLAARGHWANVDREEARVSGASLDAAGNVPRSYVQASFDWFNGGLQNDYAGEFETFGAKHKLLLGWEYRRSTTTQTALGGNAGMINIYNPVYGQKPTAVAPLSAGTFDAKDRNNSFKYLLRDQVSFWDDRIILVGGYYEIYSEAKNIRKIDGVVRTSSVSNPGVQGGLVVKPLPQLSLYYGYNDFETAAPGGSDSLGNPFRGQIKSQHEFGVKILALNDTLSFTAAHFDIIQDGLLVNDPDFPGFSIQRGEENSKGYEFDVNYLLNERLQLIASYAYTDAQQVSGLRVPVSPKNLAGAFALYSFKQGVLSGLAVGGGFNYSSNRAVDTANSAYLDSYTVLNAVVRYTRADWRYTLNLGNLTNTRYESGAAGRNNIYLGDPLNAKLSVEYTF